MGESLFGAKLKWDILDLDSSYTAGNGSTGDISGENAGRLLAFYEYRMADMRLGAALMYDWFGQSDLKTGGVTTKLAGSRRLIGLKLYTALPVGGFVFKPSLDWREKASGADYDKLSDLQFTVAGRFAF